MSCCAASCVLMSSPPPVQPCWTSLYHPSTMPSHHVGRSKRGWNASFINGILIWGREEYKIQSGPNFQGYLVAELRDAHALKHRHAIIFNCFFSVSAPCCLTPESDTVEVYKYNVWQKKKKKNPNLDLAGFITHNWVFKSTRSENIIRSDRCMCALFSNSQPECIVAVAPHKHRYKDSLLIQSIWILFKAQVLWSWK